jgi:hypothetical protein
VQHLLPCWQWHADRSCAERVGEDTLPCSACTQAQSASASAAPLEKAALARTAGRHSGHSRTGARAAPAAPAPHSESLALPSPRDSRPNQGSPLARPFSQCMDLRRNREVVGEGPQGGPCWHSLSAIFYVAGKGPPGPRESRWPRAVRPVHVLHGCIVSSHRRTVRVCHSGC